VRKDRYLGAVELVKILRTPADDYDRQIRAELIDLKAETDAGAKLRRGQI
jgi:hypothetical protein